MHEVSLVHGLCLAVEEASRHHGINRVSSVKLLVGTDCMVMHDAFLFAFDLLKPVPLMQSAVLEIQEGPGHELIIQHIEGEP